jgi:small-conductance mechanosensitive channel
MRILGVKLIGVSWDTLHKLILTSLLVAVALGLRWVVIRLTKVISREGGRERLTFWTRQSTAVVAAVILAMGSVSIWFDNPARLALPLGIVTAGVAFALQKVLTAIAGYFVILRGRTFSVGDRIEMARVRGDVIRLGFVQTTIMEMGQPPQMTKEDPATWVQARQHTGRVVTVTNDKVFETPVYNYSRLFSFIWEEIRLPIRYDADRRLAEQILLECARRETADVDRLSQGDRERMEREYFVDLSECDPHVYYRLTDNWLELTVRFIVEPRGVRERIDRMTREILDRLDRAGIQVASATLDVVGVPPLRLDGQVTRRSTNPIEQRQW